MQQRGFHLRFSHGKPKIYQSAKEQMKPSWPREIFLLTGFQAQVLSYGSPLLSGYWSPGGMSVTLRGQRSSCFTPGWAKPTKWQVFQVTNYDPPGRQSQPWMYKVAHWDTRGGYYIDNMSPPTSVRSFQKCKRRSSGFMSQTFPHGHNLSPEVPSYRNHMYSVFLGCLRGVLKWEQWSENLYQHSHR